MCSGCSGDYTRDFEEAGDSADFDGNSGRKSPPEHTVERIGLRSPVADDLRRANARANSRLNRQGNLPDASDETVQEWEVLVSGARIVEVRVIGAGPWEISELGGAEDSQMPAKGKQSRPESAKYYRTHRYLPHGH